MRGEKDPHRYAGEFDFGCNAGKLDDSERLALAVRNAEGERLRCKEPVATLPRNWAQGRPF